MTKIVPSENLSDYSAPKIEFKNKKSARLEISTEDHNFDTSHMVAMKYFKEQPVGGETPEVSIFERGRFVPLKVKTEEGEVWVKVNINSLAKRLGIDKEDIKKATSLDELLTKEKSNEMLRSLIFKKFEEFIDSAGLDKVDGSVFENISFYLKPEDGARLTQLKNKFKDLSKINKKEVEEAIELFKTGFNQTKYGRDLDPKNLPKAFDAMSSELNALLKTLPETQVQKKNFTGKKAQAIRQQLYDMYAKELSVSTKGELVRNPLFYKCLPNYEQPKILPITNTDVETALDILERTFIQQDPARKLGHHYYPTEKELFKGKMEEFEKSKRELMALLQR